MMQEMQMLCYDLVYVCTLSTCCVWWYDDVCNEIKERGDHKNKLSPPNPKSSFFAMIDRSSLILC